MIYIFLFSRAAKRAFDIVAATIGLILLSPTFLLVVIAIKIDSRGPVFRSQMLHGYSNENIPILKFRTTMVSETGKSTSFVTGVGGVLRRTGIDGLPQLINVLRGEMSIVGPPPYVAPPNETVAEQVASIQQRHRMKPGIAGWAQVHGCCGESDNVVRQRIEFDRYYIENWSFLFDIKILLMTLFSKDAYLN
jgi:lipopolysaccharide/colanic/teichoic acid biosynthesis glycosyltransferase